MALKIHFLQANIGNYVALNQSQNMSWNRDDQSSPMHKKTSEKHDCLPQCLIIDTLLQFVIMETNVAYRLSQSNKPVS